MGQAPTFSQHFFRLSSPSHLANQRPGGIVEVLQNRASPRFLRAQMACKERVGEIVNLSREICRPGFDEASLYKKKEPLEAQAKRRTFTSRCAHPDSKGDCPLIAEETMCPSRLRAVASPTTGPMRSEGVGPPLYRACIRRKKRRS